jgi:hypothetical protein
MLGECGVLECHNEKESQLAIMYERKRVVVQDKRLAMQFDNLRLQRRMIVSINLVRNGKVPHARKSRPIPIASQ